MAIEVISHYRIIDKLGHGGMAEVYEAVDTKTDKPVALKVLLPHLASDAVVKERFLREAKVGMELDHPGIVKVYEVGEDSQPFIAMELVKGKALDKLIEKNPLPLKKAIAIGQQLTDALTVAHRQGIIHRDLKPRNIMMVDGQAKIMDFGLARVVDTSSLTEKHEIIGTLYYMSPEQAIGETIDGRSDIFSLGVMLYQMLTGRRPFDGEHAGTVIHAILYSEPLRFADIGRKLPKEAEQVVFKALQKQVDKRYQSAIDLDTDLRNLRKALDGNPVTLIASDVSLEEVFEKHRGIYSALVGRERELQVLQKHLTEMLQGKPSAILISGEAGIGKSRLVWELGQRAKKQDVRYLVGRSVASGGIPYQPILEVIRRYFDIKGITTENGLDQFIDGHAERLKYRRDIVAAVALLKSAQEVAIIKKQQLWDTAAEVLKAMANDRPAVVHLDDLHWADIPTLDMLTYILRSTTDERVLIIGTYRPEDITEKGNPLRAMLKKIKKENLFRALSLKRLDKEGTQDIIKSVFVNSDFKENFAALIYKETEGNPLFVLEVLNLLRDENVITRHNTAWRLASDAIKVQIPKTVTDVIMRRLEKLDKEERELIDIAAVEGVSFSSGTLAHCLGVSRIGVLRTLQNLEDSHHLIHARKQGFQFDHGKIQEVIYSNIIPELRREYHMLLGEYYGNNYAGVDEYAASIAQHLYKAGAEERALPYFQKAGNYSKRIFANEAAIDNFSTGLEIADEQLKVNPSFQLEKMKLAMLKENGQVKSLIGRYKEAFDDLKGMVSAAESMNDKEEQMLGMAELGDVLFKRAKYEESCRFYVDALRICRTLEKKQAEPKILIGLALTTYYNKDAEQAQHYLALALEKSQTIGDKMQEGKALGYIAILSIMQSDYKRAFSLFPKALKMLRGGESKHEKAFFLNQLGVSFRHVGEHRKALYYLKKSLAIQEDIGDKENQILTLNNIGVTYDDMGKYSLSPPYYENGYHLAIQIGDFRNHAIILGNLGWVYHRMNDGKKAEECFNQALDISRRIKDSWHEGVMLGCLCWSKYLLGEYASALKYCQEGLKITQREKNARLESRILSYMANIYSHQGDFQRALRHAKRATELAEKIGIEKGNWFTFTRLYTIYFKVGESKKAFRTLDKAISVMEKCKSPKIKGWLHFYIGAKKMLKGSYNEAYSDILNCMKIGQMFKNTDMFTPSQMIAGEIELARRNYAEALEHAQKALNFSLKAKRLSSVADSYLLSANVYFEMGNYESSELNAQKAVAAAKKCRMRSLLWQAHHVLGKVYLKQKEYTQAKREFAKAQKVVDKIASKMTDELKKTYLKKKEIKELKKDIQKLENKMKKGRKT